MCDDGPRRGHAMGRREPVSPETNFARIKLHGSRSCSSRPRTPPEERTSAQAVRQKGQTGVAVFCLGGVGVPAESRKQQSERTAWGVAGSAMSARGPSKLSAKPLQEERIPHGSPGMPLIGKEPTYPKVPDSKGRRGGKKWPNLPKVAKKLSTSGQTSYGRRVRWRSFGSSAEPWAKWVLCQP